MCSDPELRHTQTGTAVTKFTLAVDRDFKDKDGNRETDFIDCTIWKGGAEFVSRYFTKGSMAVVVGSLQLRDWTDKDGNKHRSAQVVSENVYFGDSKRTDTASPVGGESAYPEEDSGDLPF